MDKERLNQLISEKLKLIRTEQGYTQDTMAEVIGLSKKTIVQIEKGRSLAGWTTTVAICALFRESRILQDALGSSDPVEIAEIAAHRYIRRSHDKTLGGRVWWREKEQWNGFRLQQNIISGHYRILDPADYRLFSTYDQQAVTAEWQQLIKKEGENCD
ncbi:helix-turn-helix transcriptional regulator [Pseudobacillus badius]|uniref:helix-turn-helix transcriptional regulator n=1 Tax=Bacillus badius TaxID=1455 RepID=UPI000597C1DC|nr:helix-turn-helix domain-containing protein [Bacillus badius]KIL74581.1 helix-turn-helix domain protein [Bacillus badius]KZR58775.1 transcriptional regulator [Bacillus badius]